MIDLGEALRRIATECRDHCCNEDCPLFCEDDGECAFMFNNPEEVSFMYDADMEDAE